MGLKAAAKAFVDTLKAGDGVEKSATVEGLLQSTLTPFTATSRLYTKQQWMEAYVDWVYAAVSVLAQDVATIEFEAYANRSKKSASKMFRTIDRHPEQLRTLLRGDRARSVSPELEELPNHVLLDLLAHPNPFMDGEYFVEIATQHLLLAGEVFWAKIRNRAGVPAQLWPMMPWRMKHVPDQRKFISGWLYWTGSEDVPWAVEDVVHIKLPNPNDFYRGMSVIQAAARAIETDTYSADWNKNYFKNSAEPGIVLETDVKLHDDVYNRLRDEWENNHRGAGNAHRLAVLEQGLKANKITDTSKDMDFVKGREFNKDQILAMVGVSASILGLTTDHNRANMEAADYNHAKRAVKPQMSRLVTAINHGLAPEYDEKLVIGYVNPVPEDKEFLLKERTESINTYRTVNEVRTELGDDPLPGGDVLYIAGTLVPLTAESAVPKPDPVIDPNADSNDPGKTPTPDDDPKDQGTKALGEVAPKDPKAYAELRAVFTRLKKNGTP